MSKQRSSFPFVFDCIQSELIPCASPGVGEFNCISQKGLSRFCTQHDITLLEGMSVLLEQDIWPLRYKMNRGIFTKSEQQRLLESCVCILGCGGLGGHVIHLLCRLGVGSFLLCDYDSFDESNLNRQLFCTEESIGKNKALTAQDFILRSASHVNSHVYTECVTYNNARELFSKVDIVFDCLDSLVTSRALEAQAFALRIPFIHAAVAGAEAFFGVSDANISEKALLESLYGNEIVDDSKNAEKLLGVLTLTPALAAVFQCQLGVQVLLNKHSDSDSMWHFDLESLSLQHLQIR